MHMFWRRNPVSTAPRHEYRADHRPSSIWSATKPCRQALAIAALFSLALNILMLAIPLYLTQIYNRVLSSRSVETLVMLTIIVLGALMMIGVFEAVRQILLARAGARLETALGASVLGASLQAAGNGNQDVQGLRDLAQIRQFLSSPLTGAMFDAPVAPFYFALLFLVHPHLGWLAVGIALLLISVAIANQRLSRSPLSKASRHGMTALQRSLVQARNAEVIRAMGMLSNSVASWGTENADSMIAADVAARRNAIFAGLGRFLRLSLQIGILGYGAWLVLSNSGLSGGIIFAASIISARALAPLDQAISGWRNFVSAREAWERVKSLTRASSTSSPSMPLPAPAACLSAEKLAYCPHPGSVPIIKGVTFKIEQGDGLGIIGPSGAGKSTLARLLVGAIQPSMGIVRIGGDDLCHWDCEALGPHIGYLPQEVELFPVSVAQNIARMVPDPDPEKIVAAARLANCHELIQSLPQGYDTMLGAQAHILSGGQRQRIGLARAFYGTPKVVVLDEPNAFLDDIGERALIEALEAARGAGITFVVVTQRSSLLPVCSKIMVIRSGLVQAFGERDAILKQQMKSVQAASAHAHPGIRRTTDFSSGTQPGRKPNGLEKMPATEETGARDDAEKVSCG